MTRLLFGAVIVMMSLPVAYAEPPSQAIGDRTSKWAGGSSSYSLPVCHLVRVRVGTKHGHPVYQTQQVCGGGGLFVIVKSPTQRTAAVVARPCGRQSSTGETLNP
jgi:hypothetical protein